MTEQKNTARAHRRNDILLIVLLLLVAGAGILYLFVFRDSGNVVKVTVDGKLYGTYSLSEDRVEDIHSGEDGHNRLIIKDGRAYMESASCSDGICVAHHPIFRDGESIVCLPNKVVATVIIDGDTDSPDIVA
ncbi:MAG: NusG domain II-containing protein [Ruminococcaceae bacterium]|nr:NusG domain II-containing protein [Oscillospiraceae bacterium]